MARMFLTVISPLNTESMALMKGKIMSVKMRQIVERRIASALIRDGLLAGYTISVHDGGEFVLKDSTSRKDILKAMFSTDEDTLYFKTEGGKHHGWVLFIYGNDGWDVISDYSVCLEHIMAGANKVSKMYE